MVLKLRNHCKAKILTWLLSRLLSKKCDKNIPNSGEKAKKVNCYVIHIYNEEGELWSLVSSINNKKNELTVNFINPEDNTFSISEILPVSFIINKKTSVRHYYKGFCIQYESLYELYLKYIIKYDIAKINTLLILDFLSQKRFNKKGLIKLEFLKLLRFMYKAQLDSCDPQSYNIFPYYPVGISEFDLMIKLHSPRWIEHPHSGREMLKLRMHLDALVASGDLARDNEGQKYIVTGKALQTIEKHETDERRHKDSVRSQSILVFIAGITLFWQFICEFIFKQ